MPRVRPPDSTDLSRAPRTGRREFLGLLAAALAAPAVEDASAGGAQASRFVAARGRRFVAPDGQPLVLKGINLGNWLLAEGYMFGFKSASSPRRIEQVLDELVGEDEARAFWREFRERYVTVEDIRFIRRAGFNCVRVPFNFRLFVSRDDPTTLEGPGYAHLDRVVEWCRGEGVYVILDLHGAPGGQTGDNIDDSVGYPFLFESPESQELTIRLWRELARRYRDEPIVAGYDLLNEPIAHYFDVEKLNPLLEPLYRRMVAAIREVDPHHVIFLGGAQWNSNFKVFGAPFAPNLAYTFHKYWTEPTQAVIQEYLDYAARHEVPLLMGESGENTDAWIDAFRKVLDQHEVSWTFWPYKKLEKTSCVVSIVKPEGWDAVVAYADAPRASFEEIRKIRPPTAASRAALRGLLDNLPVGRCRPNDGYLAALGMRRPAGAT
jgi:endoglucanase